jgi:hypothetical protein
LNEIRILLEMMKLLNIGRNIYRKIKFVSCQQKIIGEVLVLPDLVALIRKYSTEWEKTSFLPRNQIQKPMKTIGWKSGTTCLWNTIVMNEVN